MAKGLISKLISPFRRGSAEPEDAPSALPNPEPVASAPKVDDVWPATRLNVVEKMWGEGFITPGGADQVKKLLPLLDLDKKKSVLVLGPGLGGINFTMVEETGVWITGLESDTELAKLGHESMIRAQLKRQAPVRFNDLENLQLKPKSFDAALSFEGTLTVVDKKALFSAVADGLRMGGELFFSTLALPDTNPPNDKVKEWIAREPDRAKPHPWPVEAMQAMLTSLNMEVRPVEDLTADYRRWVTTGFMNYLGGLSKSDLLTTAQELMHECEYWTTRTNAIDSGGLKVVRYHAIKLKDQRKSVAELMAKR